jgi:hypothetical protein
LAWLAMTTPGRRIARLLANTGGFAPAGRRWEPFSRFVHLICRPRLLRALLGVSAMPLAHSRRAVLAALPLAIAATLPLATAERTVAQQGAVTNLDDNAMLFYSSAKVTSPAVKQPLQQVLEKKQAIARLAQERGRREQEIQVVTQEQERIRQNMTQLDRGEDLYTRDVQKFAVQEDRVEALRKEIAELQAQEQQARRGLDEMLSTLEIE